MRRRGRFLSIIQCVLAIAIIAALAGCGSGGNKTPLTPTATPTSGPVISSTDSVINVTVDVDATNRPTGTLSGDSQSLESSGCQATIPLSWAITGDGSGITASGANFTLYGGPITSDTAWTNAMKLVSDQATNQGAGTVEKGVTWIYAIRSANKGFIYRARFDDWYCDISVQSVLAVPDAERATWDAIAASLKLAPGSDATPES